MKNLILPENIMEKVLCIVKFKYSIRRGLIIVFQEIRSAKKKILYLQGLEFVENLFCCFMK